MTRLLMLFLLGAQDPASKPGLVLHARDGERDVLLVVPVPHYTLGPRESLHPQLKSGFRATWTGRLKIIRGGTYTIRGEARVVLRGKEVQGRPVELPPGEHALRIEVERPEGTPARLRLLWESDIFSSEPMPSSAFVHREIPPGREAFASIERGRERAVERGCASCHRTEGSALAGRKGPDLSHVGSRTNAHWLATWLEDPRGFRKAAEMPVLLAEDERGHVAAYLASLKDPGAPARAAAPGPAVVKRGRDLFGKTGCVQFHGESGVSLAGLGSKTDAASLARFLEDPLKVDPDGRMPFLFLHEDDATALAAFLVQSRNPAFERKAPPGDPSRGKTLVRQRGCMACHTLDDGGLLANDLEASPLAALTPEQGCLADRPAAPAPRYGLGEDERRDLRNFVRSFAAAPDRSPAPIHEFSRTIRSLRCTACHALDGSTPSGLQVMPPPLTGAGDKMRASWIDAVLTKKKRVRPWMDLRMPHFGGENVRALVRGFAAASGAPHGEGDATAEPTKEQVAGGIKLMGREKGGLSCITCHDFKGRVSLGTRGPDMVEMFARMRPDWFRRWMRDPIRIQPGTSMPTFFASQPPGETERKLDLLWSCLSAGKDMPTPVGFADARSYFLLVKDAPRVVRTFMPDSSGRSIAVGLPGGISYCFDAELCRLRYAWEGDFLDMAGLWSGRGGGRAKLLGERYYTAPEPYPLRIGDADREPVRNFLGYRMMEGGPEFRYSLDGVEVRHRIAAPEDALGIIHAFRIAPAGKPVWFVPGTVKGVTVRSTAGRIENGRIRIPRDKAADFSVTLEVEE